MKRYNNYVFENKYGSKSITEEEFDKLLSENCKNLTKFYRSIRDVSEEFMYQDAVKEKRTSIESENIHVVLMSELPSWKDYPKYDKAIVCSTSIKFAGYYYNNSGGLYEVYPYDDIKIGLCNRSCVWESFGGFYEFDSIRMTHRFLKRIFEYSSKEHDWEYIKQQIYNINDIEWLGLWDYLILNEYRKGFADKFADYFKIALNSDYAYMFTADNIIKFIEHTFDPDVNGFKMMINDENFYSDFQYYFDNLHENGIQVWFEGPALLKKIK